MVELIEPAFWSGKRVFLTGHTGFKGSWLSVWLARLGAVVRGYALEPDTTPSMYAAIGVADFVESIIGDIRDAGRLARALQGFRPDIVLHLAAQPLVRKSYREPLETFATNVMGTLHLLEAVRATEGVRAVVNVTTDKCYANREWVWGYREDEPLGGHDPYSSSKGCAELASAAWRASFFEGNEAAGVATARAGNVIGGGDWAEDRLVPDIIRAFERGQPVHVRNPSATRPWQHVLEPLGGYLMLAQALCRDKDKFAQAWNFGPRDEDARPVGTIVEGMVRRWGGGARWTRDEGPQPHEAQALKLDISKAKAGLGWTPRWTLDTALDAIVEWHHAHRAGSDMRSLTLEQIKRFETTPSGDQLI